MPNFGNTLNPSVPWASGYTTASVHPQSYTVFRSSTQVWVQFWGFPGGFHCSHFTLGSLRLGTSVTKARQNSAVSLISESRLFHMAHYWIQMDTPPCRVLSSQVHLGKYLLYVKHQQGQHHDSPAAHSWQDKGAQAPDPQVMGSSYAKAEGFTELGPRASHGCICASALTHHAENKQLKHHFLHLPSKSNLAAFHFSSPGQIHVTNSCSQ